MDKQSHVVLQWLEWIAMKEMREIRHALNYGEASIGKYKVDGLDGNTVFEFNGCAWHGCKKCYPVRDEILPSKKTAEEAYQHTLEKKKYLETNGYHLRIIWECDFRKQLFYNRRMAKFCYTIPSPRKIEESRRMLHQLATAAAVSDDDDADAELDQSAALRSTWSKSKRRMEDAEKEKAERRKRRTVVYRSRTRRRTACPTLTPD